MKAQALCIDERDDVADLHERLVAAHAELRAAESELNHVTKILSPVHATADTVSFQSEVSVLRARQELPAAEMRFTEAKAIWLELGPKYELARIAAAASLTTARNKARLPLLRKFVAALDAAKDAGEEIRAFDQETVRLGGSNPGHPFGQLLDDLPYRQGYASRVAELVKELERK